MLHKKLNQYQKTKNKTKGGKMVFAISTGLAYELVPCSDQAILAIDEDLQFA